MNATDGRLRALVHLGMPKTGTTVLQHAIVRSLSGPALGHLIYPDHGRRSVAHHEVPDTLRAEGDAAVDREAGALLAAVAAARADRPDATIVLVSSEAFTNLIAARRVSTLTAYLERVGASLDVTLAIVIRELSDFSESMYLQGRRAGGRADAFDATGDRPMTWARHFFEGLARLGETYGDAFDIHYRGPGDDIIGHIAPLIGCPADVLRDSVSDLRSTATPTLKQQATLTFIEEVSARLGTDLGRRDLVRLFDADPVFEDDLRSYTLYRPGERETAWRRYREIATEVGIAGYAAAFAAFRPDDRPHAVLEPDVLTEADLEALGRRLAAIEAPRA